MAIDTMHPSPSNLAQLERTPWARAFKQDSPVSYAEALKHALRGDLVVRIERDTNVLGDPCFAIKVEDLGHEFWMDELPTRMEAMALCASMGWRVRR